MLVETWGAQLIFVVSRRLEYVMVAVDRLLGLFLRGHGSCVEYIEMWTAALLCDVAGVMGGARHLGDNGSVGVLYVCC